MRIRKNLFPILILAAVGIVLAIVSRFLVPQSPGSVRVSVDGQEVAVLPLGGFLRYPLEGEDGALNVIVVDGNQVYMESANCRDQLCVHQGAVTADNIGERALGADIICLPHRVVVSLISDEAQTDVPDI